MQHVALVLVLRTGTHWDRSWTTRSNTTASSHAVSTLEGITHSLKSNISDLDGSLDQARVRFDDVGDLLHRSSQDLTSAYDAASTHVNTFADKLNQQSVSLRQASNEATGQLGRVGDSLNERTHELKRSADKASQLVTLVGDALGRHSEDTTEISRNIIREVGDNHKFRLPYLL